MASIFSSIGLPELRIFLKKHFSIVGTKKRICNRKATRETQNICYLDLYRTSWLTPALKDYGQSSRV